MFGFPSRDHTNESRAFRPLEDAEQLREAVRRSEHEPVVLFKHSLTCPISGAAQRRLQKLTGEDPPVYRLIVQSARPLSMEIAETFGVRHESPQVIVLHQGQPIYHASHGRVSADAVRNAVHPLDNPDAS